MEIENGKDHENYSWSFKGQVDYVDEWPLMSNPLPVAIIVTSYLAFVLKLGPEYMKNKKPYSLRNVLLVYNAFQVLFSLFLVYIGVAAIFQHGLVERSCYMNQREVKFKITEGHYLYFLAKLTELLDTVFFVLRKKWNQLSFLHVYHHTIMSLAAWTTLKYEPSYSLVFLGTLNSFVHVIMYGYYWLAAFPGLTKYLWWKKYITKMQLIQFIMVIVQVTGNSITSECPITYILLTICWSQSILFIYLFSNFYFKSYAKNAEQKNKRAERKPTNEKERQNGEQTKLAENLR